MSVEPSRGPTALDLSRRLCSSSASLCSPRRVAHARGWSPSSSLLLLAPHTLPRSTPSPSAAPSPPPASPFSPDLSRTAMAAPAGSEFKQAVHHEEESRAVALDEAGEGLRAQARSPWAVLKENRTAVAVILAIQVRLRPSQALRDVRQRAGTDELRRPPGRRRLLLAGETALLRLPALLPTLALALTPRSRSPTPSSSASSSRSRATSSACPPSSSSSASCRRPRARTPSRPRSSPCASTFPCSCARSLARPAADSALCDAGGRRSSRPSRSSASSRAAGPWTASAVALPCTASSSSRTSCVLVRIDPQSARCFLSPDRFG